MILPDDSGIQSVHVYANQRFDEPVANDIGFLAYKNSVAMLSLLVQRRTGVEHGAVVSGLSVTPDGGLGLKIASGVAVGFTGSYVTEDNVWGFSSGDGTFVCVLPEPVVVNMQEGDTDDRVDIIQVRPDQFLQYVRTMTFVDPTTEEETSQALEARRNFEAKPEIRKGTPDPSPTAPETDSGWVKIAEVYVPAGASGSSEATITPATKHENWTNESELFEYARYAPSSWRGRRTDFPSSAFAGDECYRTDVNLFFKFDGQEWHEL